MILGMAAALAVLFTPQAGLAQESDEVQFQTADKVTIKGSYYSGGGGKKSACVILLHELGSDRTKGGMDDLAKELAKAGFTVLSFDFRGHNDSCDVDPMFFWNFPPNKSYLSPNKERDKIDYKDIKKKPAYLPWLVNDVAAAKRYLETRNDANECNLSNLFIVGAKEGAAIGALWMAQEAARPRFIPNPNPFRAPLLDPMRRLQGDDLAGAVWLSMPASLSNQKVSYLLSGPLIRDKVPMAFLHSKNEESTKAADAIVAELKKSSKKVPDGTRTRALDGEGVGVELLTADGIEQVTAYLKKIMKLRAEKAYNKRDSDKLPPPPLIAPVGFKGL
jgi:hypothetical protein